VNRHVSQRGRLVTQREEKITEIKKHTSLFGCKSLDSVCNVGVTLFRTQSGVYVTDWSQTIGDDHVWYTNLKSFKTTRRAREYLKKRFAWMEKGLQHDYWNSYGKEVPNSKESS
jgi:hypothetical protein